MKKNPFNNLVLNPEEQNIENMFEKGEFVRVKNFEKRKKELASYARYTLSKNKRINIRMHESDLQAIKERAQKHGLPYQTLISTILHNYAKVAVEITL